MKNNRLTKIATVLLSVVMVLSQTITSVSALPADLTATGSYNKSASFDDDTWESWLSPITSGMSCTAEVSDDLVTAGNDAGKGSSLKITSDNDTGARIKINGVAQDKIYYMSYWYYSADSNLSVAGGTGADNFKFTQKNVKNKWIKAWTTFTASSESFIHLYGLKTNMVAYIDDVEVVEIESVTGLSNTVPADATVSESNTKTFENMDTTGLTKYQTESTLVASVENPHWGEASLKFKSARTTYSDGFYFPLGISVDANATYYMSYYVYSPNTAFTHIVKDNNNKTVVKSRTIPQGEWTKVSVLFTPTHSTFKFYVDYSEQNVVYFDDFVCAKLSAAPAETALTAGGVVYDFDAKTATVTFTSPIEIVSGIDTTNITAPAGVTVESATLSANGKTVTLELSGVESDRTVALTIANVVDSFAREKTIETSFVTPAAYIFGDVTETIDGDNATYTRNITKNSNGGATLAMIVTTYNAAGEMVSATMDINTVNGDGVPVPFTATLTKGVTHKVLVFDWADFSFIN